MLVINFISSDLQDYIFRCTVSCCVFNGLHKIDLGVLKSRLKHVIRKLLYKTPRITYMSQQPPSSSRFRVLDRKSGGGIQYNLKMAGNIMLVSFVPHNYCRMRNMELPIDADIAGKIKEDTDLRRFHEPEIILTNETEKKKLLRGQQLYRRLIQSL